MKRKILLASLSFAALAALSPSLHACDSKADVEAAFNAQHQAPWRIETRSTTDTGVVQTQQFDILPPDRIYRKVTSGEETAETIAVGTTAWMNEGSGWQEMKKGVADIVATQLRAMLAPARVSVEFKCLDKVDYDGKSYLGYQTVSETVEGKLLARTILVDPETKRPAFNIVAAPDLSGEPVMKEAYSYPTDIRIDSPL
jgi:hypothetical protein